MKIKARSYGVDVSNYQSESGRYNRAKFEIVKLTEGISYVNPRAKDQIETAKKNYLLPMGYFFATFGSSSVKAKDQALHAINHSSGLPKGSYIGVDWETGDGNDVYNGRDISADAIIEAMKVIKDHGYKPLFYSGASIMKNDVNTKKIIQKFGTCLWIASYPVGGAVSRPLFAYFPSMDGIAIWQFTDDWQGMSVDGNISLIGLSDGKKKKDDEMKVDVFAKWNVPRVFVVTNLKGCNVYDGSDLKKKIGSLKHETGHHVYGEENGAIEIGKNKWVDGRAGFTKSNPLIYDDYKSGHLKIMENGTHALYGYDPRSEKAYPIKKGSVIKFHGRKDRFFKVAEKYHGKDVWISAGKDGRRAYIEL